MSDYFGDIRLGDTIDIKFTTRQISGAPSTLGGTPVISAYPSNSTTELTAGITLTVDFDARTGYNNVRVVATGGNGYLTATNYDLCITTGTVNSVSVVGESIGSFSIENRSALMPATAARTLVVDAFGLADATMVKNGPSGAGVAQTAGDIYPAVTNIAVTGAALNANAASELLTTGTDVGGLANTNTLDGVFDSWTDAAGTIDGYYQFDVSATLGAVGVGATWDGYLVGVVNTLKVYAYNWGAAGWDQVGMVVGIAGTVTMAQEWDLTSAHTGTGGNLGLVRIRFNNTGLTAATLKTDRILLGYAVALTPAAIATGVWQDAAASDFTTASSIGKSLYTSGVVPGGSGGILISGSNAGTTTFGSLTVTGALTLTGNVLLSDGLTISAPSTGNRAGITVTGNGSGAGINVTGGGSGMGMSTTAGGGGNPGFSATGAGAGSGGVGILATASGSAAAISAVGAGHGILATAGINGATNDGIKAVAGTSGVDLRANITGNITGTLSTVTTLTNLPAITANWLTAAGINAGALNGKGDWLLASSYTAPLNLSAAATATAVWTDATAGDFTAALSIGKSIMNGVALGTGLTVNDLTTKTGFSLTAAGLNLVVMSDLGAPPAAGASVVAGLSWLFMSVQNKRVTDGGGATDTIANSANVAVGTATVTDAAGVFTKTKYA